MWKFCFFALVLYVSCSDAQTQGTLPELISNLMAVQGARSGTNIEKWGFGNLTCDSEKAAFCFSEEINGKCRSCLFVCVQKVLSSHDAKVPPRVDVNGCTNGDRQTKCVFTKWSMKHGIVDCAPPYIKVAMSKKGEITKPDETTVYHTCMLKGCDGCPSNKIFYDKEIPCQKSCGDVEETCQSRPGCGCRSDQFWNGFKCVDDCDECPPGVAHVLCDEDPCAGMKCHRHKEAVCRASTCEKCQAKFYLNGTYISTDDCYGDVCPPNVARVTCDKDPCKDASCPKHHGSEGLECRANSCGSCHPKFYLNGEPLSAADCDDGCAKDYWVECDSKEAKKCPVCTNGCECQKRTKITGGHNDGRPGTCWTIYDCFLPNY